MQDLSDNAVHWLFLDMNSYFASAEQHMRPELRGRPVGVIPTDTDRTCIIAASLDAKQMGIRTGTPVLEARAMCPGIVLVKARPDEYVRLHHRVAESIDRWCPIHKAYSIDEWAMRLTGPDTDPERAVEIGARIKRQVREDFSPWLGCSVGIAPTRLLAKIACDLQKPDGLTLLRKEDMPRKVTHLKIDDLTGIASGIALRLRGHGVETVEDLWALTRRRSTEIWGSVVGGSWWAGFHGIDEPEIETKRHSMSHANVLEPRFRTPDGSRKMLIRLIHRLGMRLRHDEMTARRLSVFVKHSGDTPGFGGSRDFDPVEDTGALLRAFGEIWEGYRPRGGIPLQVGATVSRLEPRARLSEHLFQHDEAEQKHGLANAMDKINARWGHSAIHFGGMHGCSHDMDDKIAFGRIPPAKVPRRELAGRKATQA